jgi:hypothetical protein
MTAITSARLGRLVDIKADSDLIREALEQAVGTGEPLRLATFFARYTSWNGFFGPGVASLAGKIGRARRLFIDPNEPLAAAADRSMLVASFFFDAARDEFDDHGTAERDPHRSLAQAFLKGLFQFALPNASVVQLSAMAADPVWLTALNNEVAGGYGAYRPDDLPSLFRAMGYHLGSELLADQEFSIIDATLRAQMADLVAHLTRAKVQIGPQSHNAYRWISVHSAQGCAAEAEHFEWASKGVNVAFEYVPPELHRDLQRQVERGFVAFAHDQREFFHHVNQ